MDEFNSETDSDYTSYWRDWVCTAKFPTFLFIFSTVLHHKEFMARSKGLLDHASCLLRDAHRQTLSGSLRCVLFAGVHRRASCVRRSCGCSNRQAVPTAPFILDNCNPCEVSSAVRLPGFQMMNPTPSTSVAMNRRGLWTDRHLCPHDNAIAIGRTDYLTPMRNRVPGVEIVPPLISPSLPFNIGALGPPPYFGPDNSPVQKHPSVCHLPATPTALPPTKALGWILCDSIAAASSDR